MYTYMYQYKSLWLQYSCVDVVMNTERIGAFTNSQSQYNHKIIADLLCDTDNIRKLIFSESYWNCL